MTDISAKTVMELRNKTGVSMMQCKKALVEAGGDLEAATDILRKAGAKKADKKSDRATGEGAIAVSGRAAVSIYCETDFVARNDDFLALLAELAELAASEGATAAAERFEAVRTDYITKLGENLAFGEAIVLENGEVVGDYLHSNRKLAAIVTVNGGNEDLARDLAMHVVANNPQVISPDEVSDELVAQEKEIWAEQLKNEGKPAEIIDKIMLGKEKKFREESALIKQPFVKDPETTVEDLLKQHGATIAAFARLAV